MPRSYARDVRGKRRVSVSVDADLLAEAERAAARGAVASVSAWVNDAMRLKLVHDRRLWALAAFIADHEAQHGEITPRGHGERRTRREAPLCGDAGLTCRSVATSVDELALTACTRPIRPACSYIDDRGVIHGRSLTPQAA